MAIIAGCAHCAGVPENYTTLLRDGSTKLLTLSNSFKADGLAFSSA
jgi:hypothetical protein